MKFYNADLHISVIADVKKIFTDLGHTVTDMCLSGHYWAMNRQKDSIPELDGDNWAGHIWNSRFDEMFNNHKEELEEYDAFICTYPPIFARFYEKFDKPIIIDVPIRYDYAVHHSQERLKVWNEWLIEGVKKGKVWLVANNKYDREYCKIMTGMEPLHIPSLCEYFPKRPEGDPHSDFMLYEQGNTLSDVVPNMDDRKNALPHGYKWPAIHRFKAVAHLPYQVSTMSIFEQYTANIPLIFPTPRFLAQMFFTGEKNVLSQVSTFQYFNGCTNKSILPFTGNLDPNDWKDPAVVEKLWLANADYYDEVNMPHITYFDSYHELKAICESVDFDKISTAMKFHNIMRKKSVYKEWEGLLQKVFK